MRHGSTVATNTLLERTGARVALDHHRGVRGPDRDRPPGPSRHLRAGAASARRRWCRSRCGSASTSGSGHAASGGARSAPARRRAWRARCGRARPEAIAIGFLHAYADPAHEQRVERALAASRRSAHPVHRAVPRDPRVRAHRHHRRQRLSRAAHEPLPARPRERDPRADRDRDVRTAGVAPPALAAREPARQLLSGPAAGLKAARDVARASRFRRALTLDVGGTSTDCAFIDGDLPRRRAREVAGFPIQLPMLDVDTIGAGGGSIARVDPGGLLVVGPESAAADPGPACYGRGGPATVTDALVVLGRIPDRALAGGTLARSTVARRARAGAARSRPRRALGRGRRGWRDHRDRGAHGGRAAPRLGRARPRSARRRTGRVRRRRRAPRLRAGRMLECAAVLFPRHAGVLSAIGALHRRPAAREEPVGAASARATPRRSRASSPGSRPPCAPSSSGPNGRASCSSAGPRCGTAGNRTRSRVTVDARDSRSASIASTADASASTTAPPPVEVVTLEARGALPDAPMPRDAGSAATGERRDRARRSHRPRAARRSQRRGTADRSHRTRPGRRDRGPGGGGRGGCDALDPAPLAWPASNPPAR